jgi:2-hydroxy-6-oxonona-2,4-dienedioate hydrolase
MVACPHPEDPSVPEPVAALERAADRRDVPVAGGTVCWRGFGHGPVLVLLHGGHGSWLHWVRNIEALAQRFTVWVPDMPGYGDSGAAPPGGLAALVQATAATLDLVVGAHTPVRLAGFSFGGLVAAQLAALRPGVTQLALLGSAGHGSIRRPHGKLRSWHGAAAGGDEAALADAMRHNLAVHMLHAPAAAIDALALWVHTDACRRARFRSKEISRAALIGPLLEALPAALLLVWGEHDVTADPPHVMQHLAAAHARRRALTIEGSGHWVQFERAARVNALLLDWLQP